MTEQKIGAYLVNNVGCKPDGDFGLIRFGRENPPAEGSPDIWMALPNQLLPILAIAAIKAMPQPKEGMGPKTVPFALSADEVMYGGNHEGEHVLTFEVGKGAAISFKLDASQIDALAAVLGNVSGNPSVAPPEGSKPH